MCYVEVLVNYQKSDITQSKFCYRVYCNSEGVFTKPITAVNKAIKQTRSNCGDKFGKQAQLFVQRGTQGTQRTLETLDKGAVIHLSLSNHCTAQLVCI